MAEFYGPWDKVYDSIEAELIRSQLEAEGIISFLKSDNAGGALSYFTATLGIEIIVRKEMQGRLFGLFKDDKLSKAQISHQSKDLSEKIALNLIEKWS